MTRIDFYILSKAGEGERQNFACRLAEKAYRMNHSVHIRTVNRQAAEQLDDLLWTFRDGSFVPHELLGDSAGGARAPVTIGYSAVDRGQGELLINLSGERPSDPAALPRIAEIVTADEECRRHGRKLFAEYRSDGHSPEIHNL